MGKKSINNDEKNNLKTKINNLLEKKEYIQSWFSVEKDINDDILDCIKNCTSPNSKFKTDLANCVSRL